MALRLGSDVSYLGWKNEIFDFALPMGVGLVDMAINLTKFLQKRSCVGADEKEHKFKKH